MLNRMKSIEPNLLLLGVLRVQSRLRRVPLRGLHSVVNARRPLGPEANRCEIPEGKLRTQKLTNALSGEEGPTYK